MLDAVLGFDCEKGDGVPCNILQSKSLRGVCNESHSINEFKLSKSEG